MIALALTIGMAAAAIAGLGFWQPSMDPTNWSTSRRQPTEKEQYIQTVEKYIRDCKYREAMKLLERPKYPLEELPVVYWKDLLVEERKRIAREVKKLPGIDSLDRLLG